jgi:outer membrane protein assembly factor BamE (lipoprotein component of BamABCDE complex)
MYRLFRPYLPVLLGIVVSLSGCVPFPMPPEEGDNVLTQAKIAFLSEPGTTKAIVEERLGRPYNAFLDFEHKGKVYYYLYIWRSGGVFWIVDINNEGIIDADAISKHVMLLIEFDDASKVVRYGHYGRPSEKTVPEIIEDWLTDPLPKYLSKQTQLPKD